ncbi:MAG: hypothetical protein GY841_16805 [FCB group bacterium]|nr:hypothetical protein [FCB group bacterium]
MSINENVVERYKHADFDLRLSLYLDNRTLRPVFDQIEYGEMKGSSARKAYAPKRRPNGFSSFSLFIMRLPKAIFSFSRG